MASQREPATAQRDSPPAATVQQRFLFVDTAKAKSSKQGRRNARSFVMRKARKERPWSTSKHVARQRRSPENPSPTTIGTPDLSTTPVTSTPSPPNLLHGTEEFSMLSSSHYLVVKQELCPECQILFCRPGDHLCPICILHQSPALYGEPDTSHFDPFGTLSVQLTAGQSALLHYCEFCFTILALAYALHVRSTGHWLQISMAQNVHLCKSSCAKQLSIPPASTHHTPKHNSIVPFMARANVMSSRRRDGSRDHCGRRATYLSSDGIAMVRHSYEQLWLHA